MVAFLLRTLGGRTSGFQRVPLNRMTTGMGMGICLIGGRALGAKARRLHGVNGRRTCKGLLSPTLPGLVLYVAVLGDTHTANATSDKTEGGVIRRVDGGVMKKALKSTLRSWYGRRQSRL